MCNRNPTTQHIGFDKMDEASKMLGLVGIMVTPHIYGAEGSGLELERKLGGSTKGVKLLGTKQYQREIVKSTRLYQRAIYH